MELEVVVVTVKKQLINELAQDILNLYDVEIPIKDIDEVVHRIGGEVMSTVSMPSDVEGQIQKKDDGEGFIIYVSEFQNNAQRRFTIAHELGHLFLHMGYKLNPDLWDSQDNMTFYRKQESTEREYQANEFAAAFLMPKNKYIEVMKENMDKNLVNTAKIAEYFGVSVSAASFRGKFLGLLEW